MDAGRNTPLNGTCCLDNVSIVVNGDIVVPDMQVDGACQ